MVMPQIATLLEQMDAAGLGDVVVIGADAFDATVVWSAGEVADGVFFAAHTFPPADNDVQAFLDAAAAAGAKIETISFGALAADAVQILAHAAEAACSVDGATLIATINEITDLPVTTGSVTYAGTNGVPEKDVVDPHRHGRRAGPRDDAATDVHPRAVTRARGRWSHHALRRDHGAARRVAPCRRR